MVRIKRNPSYLQERTAGHIHPVARQQQVIGSEENKCEPILEEKEEETNMSRLLLTERGLCLFTYPRRA